MPTVLIRLEGSMQSWGAGPRDWTRPTHLRPTKSGVIGLIANALGRDRSDSIEDLAALRFGVRVDNPGVVMTDYHTAGAGTVPALQRDVLNNPKLRKASKGVFPERISNGAARDVITDNGELSWEQNKNPTVTRDRYLADASFLAALEGDDAELIAKIDQALRTPARSLFLGRKAFGPAGQLAAGTSDGAVEEALAQASSTVSGTLDVFIEAPPGTASAEAVTDQPLTFAGPGSRVVRFETQSSVTVEEAKPEHDSVADLVVGRTDFNVVHRGENPHGSTRMIRRQFADIEDTPARHVTVLSLDNRHPVVAATLVDAHLEHRLVMDGFQHRLEKYDFFTGLGNGHANHRQSLHILHAMSERRENPNVVVFRIESDFPPRFGAGAGPGVSRWSDAIIDVARAVRPDLGEGDRFRYQIRVTPMTRRNGKRVAIVHEPGIESWWMTQASAAGLDVEKVTVSHPLDRTSPSKNWPHTLHTVLIGGMATVVDADKVRDAVATGFGRNLSYGNGLLLTRWW